MAGSTAEVLRANSYAMILALKSARMRGWPRRGQLIHAIAHLQVALEEMAAEDGAG